MKDYFQYYVLYFSYKTRDEKLLDEHFSWKKSWKTFG